MSFKSFITFGIFCVWGIALSSCQMSRPGNYISFETLTLNSSPIILTVSPSTGTTAGGTTLTITGSGFDEDSFVEIGTTLCPVSGTPTSTSITCITPAHAYGGVTVSVTNSDEQTASFANGFVYRSPAPSFDTTPIAPVSGSTAGGTAVVISGSNFLSGMTVKIGGVTCTSPTVDTTVTPNTVSCTTGAGSAGAVNIVITNPDGQAETSAGSYTYTTPAATAPTGLTYSSNPVWYTLNVAITSNTPTPVGGTPTSYSVMPALPTGLSLDTTTGIITGTPTAATSLATYTVTATNTAGSTTANVDIGVSDLGSGANGSQTISAGSQIVNRYTYVTDTSVSAGDSGFNVADSSQFKVGDEILVIQTQEAATATMYWEVATIVGINSTYIVVENALTNAYTSGTYDATSAKVTQVVRIPQYVNLTIASGSTVTGSSWESSTGSHYGGVVAIKATGTVTVNGTISAKGIGFRGGDSAVNAAGAATANAGESYSGKGSAGTAENNGGGGGGTAAMGNAESGAGGAYSTAGSAGSSTYAGTPGSGGSTFGVANLTNMFFGPGGGGSVFTNGCATSAPSGSRGGGIILIFAAKITLGAGGSITANGSDATADSVCAGAVGGAGAGGSIYLNADTINLAAGTVTAVGGAATTFTSGPDSGTGGAGGNGRIRLDYNSLAGATTPAAGFTGTP